MMCLLPQKLWSSVLVVCCLYTIAQACCTGANCCDNYINSNCCDECTKCTTTKCRSTCCENKSTDCCTRCPTTSGEVEPVTSHPIKIIQPGVSNNSDINTNNALAANLSVNNVIHNQNVVNFTAIVNSNNVNNINAGGCQGCATILVPYPVIVTFPPPTGTTPYTISTTRYTTSTSPCSTTPTPPSHNTTSPPCSTTPSTPDSTTPTNPTPSTPCSHSSTTPGTTTTPRPPWRNCCTVVIPCVTPSCNHYHRVCGHHCRGDYGYVPRDPCSGGCYKRDTYPRNSCWLGQCRERSFDCSDCTDDFYQDHENYFRCRGCYYR